MQPVLTNLKYISILLKKSGLGLSLAAYNLLLDTSQQIIAMEYRTGITPGIINLKIRLKVIPGKQCPGLDDDSYAFISVQVPIYKEDSIELREYKEACLKDMSKQKQNVPEEILALRGLFIAFKHLSTTLEFGKDIFNTDTIYLTCPRKNWHISIEKDHK